MAGGDTQRLVAVAPAADLRSNPGPLVTIEALTRDLQGPRHSVELQSLRGIAAMMVLLAHVATYFVLPAALGSATGLLFNASAAVLSFFVLSGFVLTLSQVDRPLTARAFGIFYLRRLFRLYPALWLATAVALLYQFAARDVAWPAGISREWIDMVRRDGLDRKLLVETLLGKTTELTLPIWTLFIELVGSALMPIVIVVVARAPWLLAALFLACVGASLSPRLDVYGAPTFMICFLYGAALVPLVGAARARLRSHMAARGLAIVALAPLWFGSTLFGLLPYRPMGLSSVLVSGLGAALLIAAIYARPAAFAFLRRPAAAWLGDISYSLYLLHMPLLALLAIGVIALFGGTLAAHTVAAWLLLMALTVAVTCAASSLSYRYVELPGVRLGKRAVAALGGARA